MYHALKWHVTFRRSQRFNRATTHLAAFLAAFAAAALLPVRAASAVGDDYDSFGAASAVGWNGTTTDLYTEQRLKAWLDDGTLDSLRSLPPTASDINTASGHGIGTADAIAHVTGNELGAVAAAQAGFTHPANSETIAEGIVYLKDTLGSAVAVETDTVLSSFEVTVSIDGHAKMRDDARVEVGAVIRLTSALGEQYTAAQTWTFASNGEYFFGGSPDDAHPPGAVVNDSLHLMVTGPTTLPLIELDIDENLMTLEELFYVRAQVGVGGGTGLAGADFGNTMQVSNIRFLDANGQVIPGLQLVGANGDAYPYNVPEPDSAAWRASAPSACSPTAAAAPAAEELRDQNELNKSF